MSLSMQWNGMGLKVLSIPNLSDSRKSFLVYTLVVATREPHWLIRVSELLPFSAAQKQLPAGHLTSLLFILFILHTSFLLTENRNKGIQNPNST